MTKTFKIWGIALLATLTVVTVVDALDDPISEQNTVLRSDTFAHGQTIVTLKSYKVE